MQCSLCMAAYLDFYFLVLPMNYYIYRLVGNGSSKPPKDAPAQKFCCILAEMGQRLVHERAREPAANFNVRQLGS